MATNTDEAIALVNALAATNIGVTAPITGGGILGNGITPITYMNSTAAIKAFCGERGGLVCTSSNAGAAFKWSFAKNEKLFFLPDQHLGRNTGHALNIPLEDMVVWDPYQLQGGLTADRLRRAKVILWKGHCSVHQRFLPEHVDKVRAKYPVIRVIVHPECRLEVEYSGAPLAFHDVPDDFDALNRWKHTCEKLAHRSGAVNRRPEGTLEHDVAMEWRGIQVLRPKTIQVHFHRTNYVFTHKTSRP